MRKIISVAAVAAIILGFAACQKDGVFNPKKKITEISASSENTYGTQVFQENKHVTEVWTWDKNLLKSIEYKNYKNQVEDKSNFIRFEYSGKQVKTVTEDNADGKNKIYEYAYDKSKLTQVKVSYQGVVLVTANFEHNKDNKISKITLITELTTGVTSKLATLSPAIQFVMPEAICQLLSEQISKGSVSKATTEKQIIAELSWKGNNMTESVLYNIDTPNDKTITSYGFDTKKNPVYNDFSNIAGSNSSPALSENNIVKKTTTAPKSEAQTTTYEYTYDGKFPKECTSVYRGTYYGSSYTSKNTTYYTYK